MRRSLTLSALLVAGTLCLPAAALDVVLKDGRTLSLAKPWVKKGNQAILTLSDGRLVSIRADEIDEAKTAARAAVPAATPVPTPEPAAKAPLTPAEAARQKGARKATVIITDQDVGGAVPQADRRGPAEGKVEIVGTTSSRNADGYTLTASAVNSGNTEVTGLTVVVEAVGENNKIISSGFAQLARGTLGPGERTALTASVQTDKPIVNFRFVPNWAVKMTVKSGTAAGEGGAKPGGSPGEEAMPGEGEGPKAKEEAAKPEPTPIPRGDYAAPPASAPVGAPTTPGGTYMPQPSDNQPKPPGGS